MRMEFGRLREEDMDAYFRVRQLTYNSGVPIPQEQRTFKVADPYTALLDGQVAGVFVVLDMNCTRGQDTLLRCAGIAGVAVLPEMRQTGVGSEMMRWSLKELRDQGFEMASLYAFRESFYRKFGYELCGKRIQIVCPQSRLPRLGETLAVRRLEWNDPAIRAVQAAYWRARSGGCIRDEKLWSRVVDENKAIYAAGDPIEAYAIIQHSVDFWEEQYVNEFLWTTRTGYEAMLSTLSSIAINKTALRWFETSDSPFLARFADQGVKFSLERPIMYRLLNVKRAFESLKPGGRGSFSFRVLDELLPENEGPWRVNYEADAVELVRSDEADFTIDIRHLTQIFLGEPSAHDLIRTDVLNLPSDTAVKALTSLLPSSPVSCFDFF